jgi:hypothetical protein
MMWRRGEVERCREEENGEGGMDRVMERREWTGGLREK